MLLRAKTGKGFTLIELSVVILLIALFAAAIVPNLGRQKDARLEAQFYEGARRLAVVARNRAIQSGTTMVMKYDDATQTLEVVPDTSGANNDTSETVLDQVQTPQTQGNSSMRAQTFVLEGADSNASEWQISFFGDGRATAGSIQFNSGRTLQISANGMAQLIEGSVSTEPESWEAGQLEQRQ
ncbi:MAG: GspH/FimT family pseudopilin [Fimbriimonas sp.]